MLKLLTKLAQPFVELDFISASAAEQAIANILQLDFIQTIYPVAQPPVSKIVKTNKPPVLNDHLKNIDELRQMLLQHKDGQLFAENWINYVLSFFMPTNEVINQWPDKTKYARLYLLSQFSYYIKTDQNSRNLIFNSSNERYGDFTISINLAKPEKTQAQILAEKNAPKTNSTEPKCGICIENLNFHGTVAKPSRENLRVVYENLTNEKWFFQYSPYAYLGGHFVINNIEHTPMVITDQSIEKLFAFVEKHPEFMLGSNADLPIVGGSLLGHNHFQGALDRLPITKAKSFLELQYDKCKLELLYWPLNTIRVSGADKQSCIIVINKLINFWRKYQPGCFVNNQNNTVTLITEKLGHNFICYVILRNNSTSEQLPFGNYHVHPEKFHIKQENIGLMEAAGLAILPGRLITEFTQIIDCLNADQKLGLTNLESNEKLNKHSAWVKALLDKYPTLTYDILIKETANVFISGLEDCTILKKPQFIDFLKQFLVAHPIVVKNTNGLVIEFLSIGNIIKQIYLHDKPLLLEYSNPRDYLKNDILLNAFVGPACGRIEQGKISINDKQLQLSTDKHHNYMHGMQHKWSDLLYDITIEEDASLISVHFKAVQNNSELMTQYTIHNKMLVSKNDNAISFNYDVSTPQETLCNPSHHFYWSLNNKHVLGNNLDFQPQTIWKLNAHKNPLKAVSIKPQDNMPVQAWMQYLDTLTSQNAELIDHPFKLLNSQLEYSSPTVNMLINSSLNELVIYTYLNIQDGIFKSGQQQGICFEYQHIPTSLANPNFKDVITKHYKSWTNYLLKLKN